MNKNMLISFVVVLLVIVGGIAFFSSKPNATSEEKKMTTASKASSATSEVLAGKVSQYLPFTKDAYEKALANRKIIFLEFYANWCPICRAQAPNLAQGFDALDNPDIIGFRVNYNDSDTDASEKKLADDFGVTYQHTHVILKNGTVVKKSLEDLDKDSFLALIQEVSN